MSRAALRVLRAVLDLVRWEGWHDATVLAIVAGGALILLRPAIFDGLVFAENDTRVFYYPLMAYYDLVLGSWQLPPLPAELSMAAVQGFLGQAWDQAANLQLPLWTPHIFGGFPLFADGETGMLYPINLLALLSLSATQAFVWLRVVRFFLAGAFMYAFSRALGMSRLGGLVAALVFAFGSFLVAQMHHTNVADTAIWLPLIFCFVERALRTAGRRRQINIACAGAALGIEALAVHVQPVLMTVLALALYVPYRVLLGPVVFGGWSPHLRSSIDRTRLRRVPLLLGLNLWRIVVGAWLTVARRVGLAGWILGVVYSIGFGLAAVQVLPLRELGSFSFRGTGVQWEFAVTYSAPVQNIIALLFPYFFKAKDGTYWSVWTWWETGMYVGIPTLALALIGALFARGRTTFFFVLLAVLAMLAAFGGNSPVPVYRFLWELPGFDVLRAPGRFVYLFVFAMAALAGFGASWLDRNMVRRPVSQAGVPHHEEPRRGWFGAYLVFLFLAIVVIVWGLVTVSDWLSREPAAATKYIQGTYLSLRPRNHALPSASTMYDGLRNTLGLANPQTAHSLILLAGTFALLLLWHSFRTARQVWRVGLVALLALDLLSFGAEYHPLVPLQRFTEPEGPVRFLAEHRGFHRSFTEPRVWRAEPNLLIPYEATDMGGYSSLQFDRHREYVQAMQYADNSLLDLAGVRYLVKSTRFVGLPSFENTSFHPDQPLATGGRGNANSHVVFKVSPFLADSVKVISALTPGASIPQGEPVAEVILSGPSGAQRTAVLRAGIDTADWAYDRPDVQAAVKHGRARVAALVWQQERDGRRFQSNFYYSQLAAGPPLVVDRVEFRYLHPQGTIQVWGLALYNGAKWEAQQIYAPNKEKYSVVYKDSDAIIYENSTYLPRALLVPQVKVARAGPWALDEMVLGSFDPRRVVVLEDRFDTGLLSTPNITGTAEMISYERERVVVRTRSEGNAMLVLADSYYPGWKARLDGQEVQIYHADYLFRAVYVPAGEHTVDFQFEPRTVDRGGALTALTGTGLLALWAYSWGVRPAGWGLLSGGWRLLGPPYRFLTALLDWWLIYRLWAGIVAAFRWLVRACVLAFTHRIVRPVQRVMAGLARRVRRIPD